MPGAAMRSYKARQMVIRPLQWMVEEATAYIREHEPPEGYYLGFSGGKDSIVTLDLVKKAGVQFQPFYSATGIDPPEVVQCIRKHYPEVKWIRPKSSFFSAIAQKHPPTKFRRWY